MIIKAIRHPETGDRAMLLCSPDGSPIPNQRATKLECGTGEVTLFTATFVVDGQRVKLGD